MACYNKDIEMEILYLFKIEGQKREELPLFPLTLFCIVCLTETSVNDIIHLHQRHYPLRVQ